MDHSVYNMVALGTVRQGKIHFINASNSSGVDVSSMYLGPRGTRLNKILNSNLLSAPGTRVSL